MLDRMTGVLEKYVLMLEEQNRQQRKISENFNKAFNISDDLKNKK